MTDITNLFAGMSDDQRTALASMLLQQLGVQPESAPTAAATEAATATAVQDAPASSYYDMSEAVPVTFKADLSVNEKSRDKSFATKYDHVWCKGSYRVKGPKGGVYFVGRCVMGVKKGQQVKGTLRVGNKYFEPFLTGGQMDAWFRPDGADEAILIGTLSNYRTA
jgi:hypothetical protein